MSRKAYFYRRVSALAGGLLLALAALEVGLRILYVSYCPLAYRYPLGGGIARRTLHCYQLEYDVSYTYNRCGFRDNEWQYPPAEAERRILFLGDSFVEGQGVPAAERFTSRYARALKPFAPDVKTLNAGQIATQPRDYLANLSRFGIAFRPTAVIATLSVCNDFMKPNTPYEDVAALELPYALSEPPLFIAEMLALAGAKRTPRLARRLATTDFWPAYFRSHIDRNFYLHYLQRRQIDALAFEQFCRRVDAAALNASWQGLINPSMLLAACVEHFSPSSTLTYGEDDVAAVVECFCRMRDICADHGIRFCALIIPDISQVDPDLALSSYRAFGYDGKPARVAHLSALLSAFCRELQSKGIPFLDTTPFLRQAASPPFFCYDQHLNSAGHAIVADALSAFPLLREWLRPTRCTEHAASDDGG